MTIEKMRIAGKLAANTIAQVAQYIKPGVTLKYLDQLCETYVINNGGNPALKGYRGFPAATCISVNHVVCHGIPNNRCLKQGDIVSIDITVEVDGFYGDTCRTFSVGRSSIKNKRLIECAEIAMWEGIKQIKAGVHSSEIGRAIETHAKLLNLKSIKEYCGHGIGDEIHKEPNILNYYDPNVGEILKPGMYITVEPMITTGKGITLLMGDGWTVITKDREPCAQFEHTVAVTDAGYEILTLPD